MGLLMETRREAEGFKGGEKMQEKGFRLVFSSRWEIWEWRGVKGEDKGGGGKGCEEKG